MPSPAGYRMTQDTANRNIQDCYGKAGTADHRHCISQYQHRQGHPTPDDNGQIPDINYSSVNYRLKRCRTKTNKGNEPKAKTDDSPPVKADKRNKGST